MVSSEQFEHRSPPPFIKAKLDPKHHGPERAFTGEKQRAPRQRSSRRAFQIATMLQIESAGEIARSVGVQLNLKRAPPFKRRGMPNGRQVATS
jgi:hypothetical protein